MHRFFVAPASIQNDQVVFADAQARQLHDVLRLRAGEHVIVLDNSGNEHTVELEALARNAARGRIVETRAARGEPRTRLILYQALLKADKFEWVLQKGTELGIAEFAPIGSARSVVTSVSKSKAARWQNIVAEAAEQSGRGKIPVLHPLQTLDVALDSAVRLGGLKLIPWEQEHTHDLAAALASSADTTIHLFIGPEGGLTAQEIDRARAIGIQPITLGTRILRAETAGLVASSAIFYARGELNAT